MAFSSAVLLFLILFRADYASIVSSTSLFMWPIIYIFDTLTYVWLCLALASYSIINTFQANVSGYLYNATSNKLVNTIRSGDAQSKLMLSSIAPNKTLDNNWLKLVHGVMTSRLSIDKISSASNELIGKNDLIRSSNTDVSIFLTTDKSNFIGSTLETNLLYPTNIMYSSKASALLDNVYFNSNTSLNSLSNNASVSSVYSNAISENLSLANQTRWLLRMSPISEKIIKDNFNFTQAKQLLGSPITHAVSSSNNIWASNNLSKIKDTSSLLLSENISKIEFFEDSRAWSMKKMLLGLNHSTYSLNFEPSVTDKLTNSESSSLATAYLLDYNLMQNLLSLPSSTLGETESTFNNSNLSLVSGDKTVYQDSFNNYLFNISTTTLSGNLPSYKYSNSKTNTFKFL